MNVNTKFILTIVLLAGLLLGGCQSQPTSTTVAQTPLAPVERAIAIVTPTEGSTVKGSADFSQTKDAVDIVINLEGLEPNSVHGWHIHEFGDMSDPSGKAMGGHYNPEKQDHALPNKTNRHAGDLGNLTADAQGKATQEITVNNISLNGGKNPILGRGLIIHADEDDGSQPTGNAGDRIAQGVIGVRQVAQP